jgi:hypothetical protein
MLNFKGVNRKKVVFSKNLYVYNNKPINGSVLKSGNVIVCTGYLNCSPCVLRLKEIEAFKKLYPNINIIYIAAGDISEYSDYQIDINNFSFPVFHDAGGIFIKMNELEKYDRSVFLLNENNEIVLVGSPFNNTVLRKYYLELLTKQL